MELFLLKSVDAAGLGQRLSSSQQEPHMQQLSRSFKTSARAAAASHWHTKHHWRFTLAQGNADGAYFGTTFPHLLLMTYPSLRPPPAADSYVPRVFGFKLHPSALGREPAGVAGASSSGAAAAGPSAAAALANNAQRGAGASTSAPAGGAGVGGDRRGKRREDERQQQAAGGSNATRTMASIDGDSLDGRQEMDIMRPR